MEVDPHGEAPVFHCYLRGIRTQSSRVALMGGERDGVSITGESWRQLEKELQDMAIITAMGGEDLPKLLTISGIGFSTLLFGVSG